MIKIKSRREIEKMRTAGKILAETFEVLKEKIEPGISTKELDEVAKKFIKSHNATCSFKNYNGYPGNICASLNDMVVHGIPSKKIVLCEGDIISLDLGVCYDGFHADSAKTFAVGEISEEDKRLISVTKQSFYEGLKYATPEHRLFDISASIQNCVEKNGFSVVRKLVGHGVGSALHEEPEVPNFGTKGHGVKLIPGMTIAVEPMVNMGTYDVNTLSDGWTVVTADGKKSAHYEHTVLITKNEPDLLTVC